MQHTPVLLQEVIQELALSDGMRVIDATLDGGGHARAIIPHIMPHGHFVGVDWDANMITRTEKTLREEFSSWKTRLSFVHANYATLADEIKKDVFPPADRLLADLGFSSMHIDDAQRGMSFLSDGPLDMRYDRSTGPTAADIVNGANEKELADIFWRYGEERYARPIAKKIVTARRKERILTTKQLCAVLGEKRHAKIHPATRVFQALRIAVNRELDNLEQLLVSLPTLVRSEGIVAIISFHSLEDRMVKHAFADYEKNGVARALKKPLVASPQEIQENPKSRSAKLRILRFLPHVSSSHI